MIVISIENLSVDTRAIGMTPTNAVLSYTGDTAIGLGIHSGFANKFLDFMEFELFPYVDSIYHPMDYRIISGHSFGDLSCYCFVSWPYLLDAYIASDPSFWYDNNIMSKLLASKTSKAYNNK
jgi:predicted alpha/beta superfamily hydrolase